MSRPHPQPSSPGQNQSRANDKPDLDPTPLADGLLTHLCEFLKARAAGTEMIQPLFNFSQSKLMEGDASEDCRVRTAHTLRIGKFV